MAFIFEHFIPDEHREEVNRITRAVDTNRSMPLSWMVDKERGAYLLCFSVGNNRDGEPESGRYALAVNGGPVTFEAYQSGTFVPPKDNNYSYIVVTLKIPPTITGFTEADIKGLIGEALEAHAKYYSNQFSTVLAVTTTFRFQYRG